MSNILILNGSPRHNGNTDLLSAAFAQGVACRHRVTTVRVADLDIRPCRGCNACFASNVCSQNDDMPSLYSKLADTDVLVLASPVYFYGFSAQLAAAVNRLHNPVRDTFHITKAALLLVAASHKTLVAAPPRLQYASLLRNFNIEDVGQLVAFGVAAPGDILRTEYLDAARRLAEKL